MVISSSQLGGAEKQFLLTTRKLLSLYDIQICIIGKPGPRLESYQSIGVPIAISKGTLFSDIKTLVRSLLDFHPNTVISWLYRADILSCIFSKLIFRAKIITSARNTKLPNSTWLKEKTIRFTYNNLSDVVVANSEKAKAYHVFIGVKQEKIHVIPNFVESVPIRQKRLLSSQYRIGVLARKVPYKGHLEAIAVANALVKRGHKILLSFIGNGPFLKDLKVNRLVDEGCSLEDLEGVLDLNEWFSNLDLLLALSTKWDSDSNATIEAISRGIPVVCSPLQSTEGLLKEMTIVDPHDPMKIALEIERIIGMDMHARNNWLIRQRNKLLISRDSQSLTQRWVNVIEETGGEEC